MTVESRNVEQGKEEQRQEDQGKEEQRQEDQDHVTRIRLDDREIILIGTAHVSRQSAEQVKEIIGRERPDAVCVELDEQRYRAITEGSRWKEMDIFKVIKEKKAALLLVNLMVSSFQRRMAKQFGIQAGQEMIQGIESAKEIGAHLVLADRSIQVTFSRIWSGVGFWGKMRLMTEILAGIFANEPISEEEMEELKSRDMLETLLKDFADHFPRLKAPLIDERDMYLAQKIREAPGRKIVAVLGAAHVPGVSRLIHEDRDVRELEEMPPKSWVPRVLGWGIPAAIVALLVLSFAMNPEIGVRQTLSWVLWTGSLSALGAALAFAHPLAILAGFVAAPITALHPLLAAGWFAGIAQAYFQRPQVRDFETLAEDVLSVKGFWRNRVTRVLLVVMLSNIGTSIGTFIGGADLIRNFLGLFR